MTLLLSNMGFVQQFSKRWSHWLNRLISSGWWWGATFRGRRGSFYYCQRWSGFGGMWPGLGRWSECIKLSPVVVESAQSDGDEEDECQLVNDPRDCTVKERRVDSCRWSTTVEAPQTLMMSISVVFGWVALEAQDWRQQRCSAFDLKLLLLLLHLQSASQHISAAIRPVCEIALF